MSDVKDDKKSEVTKQEENKVQETPKKEETTKELTTRRQYHPLSMLRGTDRFFSDITRWFDDMFWRPSRIWDYEPFNLSVFDDDEFFRTPLSNVTEDEKAYHLTAELPGIEKGDIEISIRDATLEIKGEKKEEHEDKDEKGYVRKEYSSSSYYRSFKLPENVNDDAIDATFEKGVLKLDMPKLMLEEKEKKKVEVK